MEKSIKLNANNLSLIPKQIRIPSYDRSRLNSGIVHIGVGNFHRSHEAFYTDLLLNKIPSEWGICGIGLLKEDQKMYKTLKNQDGLYTLLIMEAQNIPQPKIIGSIIEYFYAPEDPESVIEKMAGMDTKIISLTITEGGYNFDSVTCDFMILEPSIQWDLKHPDNPVTVFGYLTQALKRRLNRGLPGVSILSCDNIQENGDICKKMLLEFVNAAEPSLTNWIENNCTFPNCMVDRITPATNSADIEMLKLKFGIDDDWPVVCEPFIQWVIEDNFTNGRPEWETVGVQFVKDVAPYERMKIRLLNAGHTLLGLSGTLLGYTTIDESITDPLLIAFLRKFMDDEVTPVLGIIEGVDIEKYKKSLINRFSNTSIKDQLSRICSESSAKIPKFLIPTILEQLDRGGSITYAALVLAFWSRYLELANTSGYNYDIKDTLKEELLLKANASLKDDPLSFLKIKSIFGNLAESERFVNVYIPLINALRKDGIEKTLEQFIT